MSEIKQNIDNQQNKETKISQEDILAYFDKIKSLKNQETVDLLDTDNNGNLDLSEQENVLSNIEKKSEIFEGIIKGIEKYKNDNILNKNTLKNLLPSNSINENSTKVINNIQNIINPLLDEKNENVDITDIILKNESNVYKIYTELENFIPPKGFCPQIKGITNLEAFIGKINEKYIEYKHKDLYKQIEGYTIKGIDARKLITEKINEKNCEPLKLLEILLQLEKQNPKNPNKKIKIDAKEVKNIMDGVVGIKENTSKLSLNEELKKYSLELTDFHTKTEKEIKKILNEKGIIDKNIINDLTNSILNYDKLETKAKYYQEYMKEGDIQFIEKILANEKLSENEKNEIIESFKTKKDIIENIYSNQERFSQLINKLGFLDNEIKSIEAIYFTQESINNFYKQLLIVEKSDKYQNLTKEEKQTFQEIKANIEALQYIDKRANKKGITLNYSDNIKEFNIENKKQDNTKSNTDNTKSQNNIKSTPKSDTNLNYQLNFSSDNSSLTYKNKGKDENIKISDTEAKIIETNPAIAENLINFYEFFNELNLKSVWEYREELAIGIGDMNININDGNLLNNNELLLLGNKLINFINNSNEKIAEKKGNEILKIETSNTISGLKNNLVKYTGANTMLSDEKTNNIYGEDKFAATLRKMNIIGNGYGFKINEFRKNIKK